MISRRKLLQFASASALVGFKPALAMSAYDEFIEITADRATALLLGENSAPVPVWAFDGTVPGPTIRARKGDTIRIRLRNALDQPTSIHWHGIRIDNAMDGVAGLTQAPVEPGASFDYVFKVPDAGTFWYHSHNRSWEQVERGLYGALIVDEPEQLFDPANDVTLVIDDWRINQSGRIEEDFGNIGDWSHGGRLGNWLTVNGQSRPAIPLKRGEPSRVRLINAANARILELDLEGIGAKLIAYDGQTFDHVQETTYNPVLLGPAQRIDMIVTPSASGVLPLREMSGTPFEFAHFLVSETSATRQFEMSGLSPNLLPDPDLAGARTFELHMGGGMMGRMTGAIVEGNYLEGEALFRTKQVWAFNGVAGLAEKSFFSAQRGESIVVRVINDTAFPHAMHVHGHHFRVIERSGSKIDKTPWRDTFLIGPTQETTIAFVADNPGKWLIHCHMLEHQAAGMKTWFEVG